VRCRHAGSTATRAAAAATCATPAPAASRRACGGAGTARGGAWPRALLGCFFFFFSFFFWLFRLFFFFLSFFFIRSSGHGPHVVLPLYTALHVLWVVLYIVMCDYCGNVCCFLSVAFVFCFFSRHLFLAILSAFAASTLSFFLVFFFFFSFFSFFFLSLQRPCRGCCRAHPPGGKKPNFDAHLNNM
jgi:hypothetical protein